MINDSGMRGSLQKEVLLQSSTYDQYVMIKQTY